MTDDGELTALLGERKCPPAAMLLASEEGALPEETQQQVRLHLTVCALCQELMAGLKDAPEPELTPLERNRIRGRIGLPPLSEPPRKAWLWWISVPALAATAATVTVFYMVQPGPQRTPAVAEQKAAPVTVAELRLPLTPEPLRASLDSLVWRGEDAKADVYASELNEALRAYTGKRYEEAVAALEKLVARNPEASAPRLYLGVSLLMLGRHGDALKALESAREASPSIRWYRAIAYERGGQIEKARAELAAVCAAESPHRKGACEALEIR